MMLLATAMRATFGFSNPNAAGALFTMIALGVWLLPGKSRWAMALKATVTMGGIILMAMTASRGAVIALLVGGVAWWLAAGRPWPRRRRPIVAVAALFLGVMIVVPGTMGKRLARSSPKEPSLACRMEVYRAIPQLLVSAPEGWGSGQAAAAYEHWFQRDGDIRHFKNLLSTHGTWLVEWSWPIRFLYLMGWGVVLLLAWRVPVVFGIWIAWATACCFSHLGKEWGLWVIPIGVLLPVFWNGINTRLMPPLRQWLVVGGAALTGCLLLGALGISGNTIRKSTHSIVVGRGGDLFYQPDERVLGAAWGKLIRAQGNGTVATDWEGMKQAGSGRIVFSGNAPVPPEASLPNGALLWINPPPKLDDAQRKVVLSAKKSLFLWGQFRTDANPMGLRLWAAQSGVAWADLPGTGLYVPGEKLDWARLPLCREGLERLGLGGIPKLIAQCLGFFFQSA